MPDTKVFVGGMTPNARERDVEKFLRGYGTIRKILMKSGYCFVDFQDYRDAKDACYQLNGKKLLGDRVRVQFASGTPHGRDRDRWGGKGRESPTERRRAWLERYGPPTRTDYKIVVENLSSRVKWQDLKDMMRKAGDVTYADAHKSRQNEGVVEFRSKRDMMRAIDRFDGTELKGRRIKLIDCYRKRSRSRSRSPRRSRSRSPMRSRSRSRSVDRRRRRARSRSGSSDAGKRIRRGDRDRSNDDMDYSGDKSDSDVDRGSDGDEQKEKERRAAGRSPRSRSRSRSSDAGSRRSMGKDRSSEGRDESRDRSEGDECDKRERSPSQ